MMLPFSRVCLAWHGVLKIFPTFSECWWFGGSIKRNTGIVWMLPSANCVGRTLMGSFSHGVMDVAAPARNGPPGFFKFPTSFIWSFWAKF